jgi:membrane protein DedA with SNARE-associated domain
MEHFQNIVLTLVHTYGYAGLFLVMILGNVAVPVGTEIVVPVAGAAAGTGHLSSWILAGAVATLGEIVGGILMYAIGYYVGEPVIERFGRRAQHELERVHDFYGRYGTKTVLICRFIPMIRGISSLPAGISRMPQRYFLPYHTLGSAIFCFGLAFAGFTLGRHLDAIFPIVRKSTVLIVAAIVVAIVVAVLRRRRTGVEPGF